MNWDKFERHAVRHWKKYLIGALVIAVLVFVGTLIPWSGEHHDEPTKMVTVATYQGEKIKVNENVIFGVVFLLFVLFSSIGDRKCNCKGCK